MIFVSDDGSCMDEQRANDKLRHSSRLTLLQMEMLNFACINRILRFTLIALSIYSAREKWTTTDTSREAMKPYTFTQQPHFSLPRMLIFRFDFHSDFVRCAKAFRNSPKSILNIRFGRAALKITFFPLHTFRLVAFTREVLEASENVMQISSSS